MSSDAMIKKRVEIEDFLVLIKKYRDYQIECTSHTFFRLSEKQREIFTCEELRKILLTKKPFLAGI